MDNLGFGSASNPYLDKSVNDSLGDTTRAYNMTTAPAYTSAMVRSGSFGNSGVDQMQGESQRQLQTSLGRQANDMRSQNYQFDSNFDRGTYNDAFGQNQQNFQNGIGLMDRQHQYNTQDLGFGTQVQNTPMNYYQGFANSANSIGQGYGNSSSNASMSGSPLLGALGGAQLGAQFGKQMGWGAGSSGNGNGGYSSGGQSYNNSSAYGGSQPYQFDSNSYSPTW